MPDSGAALYDQDFYAWANEQAALLRAGKLSAADIEHIAEEIESMGKTEKRELVNRLAVLMLHLLKWQFQPGLRGLPSDEGHATGGNPAQAGQPGSRVVAMV